MCVLEIAALLDRQRRRLLGRLDDLVADEDVVDRPAVGHDVAVEAPVLAQDLAQEPRLADADRR